MSNKWRRTLWCWLLLSPLLVVIVFPFAVMFLTAVKPATEIYVYPARWLPVQWHWGNFAEMWELTHFSQALWNSVVIGVSATLLTLVLSVPAAYAFARQSFAGKDIYRQFLLVTQMLSPILLVVGLFRLAAMTPWGDGNLIDSPVGVVLSYAAFSIAFAVWMLSNYFETIPKDLEESAWLEGASYTRAVVKVFLPLAAPAMVATTLFTFVNAWNEFAVIYTLIRSDEKKTITVLVTDMVAGKYQVQWQLVMAAAICATVPVAVLFAWMQRYLVKGLAMGAVK